MLAVTRLRHMVVSTLHTVAPSSNAATGPISPIWPEGATTPKAILLAQAGASPTSVTIRAATMMIA
jgi:hypothetical protein